MSNMVVTPTCCCALTVACAAFAAHAILSSRYPVMQPKFDAVLKKQLAQYKYNQADIDKAFAVAAPVAWGLLKER